MHKLLILFAVFAVISANPLNHTNRIIGGRYAFIEEFPYQVAVGLNDFGPSCGGGILSEHWVLTAAFCPVAAGQLIRAGSSYHNTSGSIHVIVLIVKSSKYQVIDGGNGYTTGNIMLLRVAQPFTFDRTRQPMLLFNASDQIYAYDRGVVAGWGFTEDGPQSLHLKSVKMPVIHQQKCNENLYVLGGIRTDQFCVANPIGGNDVCFGDLGSPIAINGRIAGIVSWDRGCGDAKYYGIYTKITPYLPWIKKILETQ